MKKLIYRIAEIKNSEKCPNCGSTSYRKKKGPFAIKCTCKDCGTEWSCCQWEE